MRTKPKQRDSKARAKVFWTGRSQAIRLPKEFRFETDTVSIRREGNRVILEPDLGWPEGYVEWMRSGPHLPPDFELPARGPARSVDHLSVGRPQASPRLDRSARVAPGDSGPRIRRRR